MATFNTAKFDTAVTNFKALFAGYPELFLFGQFHVTNRSNIDLLAGVGAALGPAGAPFVSALAAGMANLTTVNVSALNAQLNALALLGVNVGAASAFLAVTPADAANAKADYNAVWSTTAILPKPTLTPATLGKSIAAYNFEKDKCFATARSFAAKYLKASGGPTALPAAAVVSQGVIANAAVAAVPGLPQLQNLVYGTPAGLTSVVTKMKAVIDAKGAVQCGLLSGLKHDMSAFPNPEHYVLAFAYDTIGSDTAFLFWDPDAAVTNIATTSWGTGFGVLFAGADRFGTATDSADLNNVNSQGEHTADPARHRYQVYYVQSLPL